MVSSVLAILNLMIPKYIQTELSGRQWKIPLDVQGRTWAPGALEVMFEAFRDGGCFRERVQGEWAENKADGLVTLAF